MKYKPNKCDDTLLVCPQSRNTQFRLWSLFFFIQYKQEKQLKDLEAARMKRSCWAVTRDEPRENSCKLETSRRVQPCPWGAMGRGGPSPQEAPSPARGLSPLRPSSRARHGCALLPQLDEPSSPGEKRCSAARQANKLIACKCMFVLEFPPAATAAWQHAAMLRHGKGWHKHRCSGEQCLLQPQNLMSSLH